jgi:2-Cys peroxiredoxin 5
LPEYFKLVDKFQQKGIASFNVVAVNDSFVTKSWNDDLVSDHGDKKFRFFADPAGNFVREMELDFDATSIFGNHRSKRFAAVVEDGTISKLFVEPDNTGIDVSAADNVLRHL